MTMRGSRHVSSYKKFLILSLRRGKSGEEEEKDKKDTEKRTLVTSPRIHINPYCTLGGSRRPFREYVKDISRSSEIFVPLVLAVNTVAAICSNTL